MKKKSHKLLMYALKTLVLLFYFDPGPGRLKPILINFSLSLMSLRKSNINSAMINMVQIALNVKICICMSAQF